jgi:hypothetical protein
MSFSLNGFKRSIEAQNVMHGNRYIFAVTKPPALLNLPDIGMNYTETVTFRAESVMFPGMILASADGIPPRLGYGAVEGIPYNIVHEDINVVFGLDDKGLVHKFFYEWLNIIVNSKAYGQSKDSLVRTGAVSAYEVRYKEEYMSDIDIYVLGPEHRDSKYTKEYVMHVKLYRAYPKMLPSLNLSYAEKNNYLRFPVQFNYTDFIINYKKLNGGTDVIAKIS